MRVIFQFKTPIDWNLACDVIENDFSRIIIGDGKKLTLAVAPEDATSFIVDLSMANIWPWDSWIGNAKYIILPQVS
jgi:hypothetical protein